MKFTLIDLQVTATGPTLSLLEVVGHGRFELSINPDDNKIVLLPLGLIKLYWFRNYFFLPGNSFSTKASPEIVSL